MVLYSLKHPPWISHDSPFKYRDNEFGLLSFIRFKDKVRQSFSYIFI